ncbi:hypothetical protein CWO84_22450 [Methylomonas sp. Kb3]|uniref:hypothetical protein n=1 Tax=Methylomonas sp. Kb3 TaxID=1611544 RepID=UPI000C32AF2D|nr:hypothetical protein [Methylomonas sp. Kb3]PKD38009.1 hypothetical protein CWO84_22450 [Methylomonas sp. Kb3]
MNPELINAAVTFAVGLIALIVYGLKKRAEKRNAATIVVMDIRHAEQVVISILEKQVVDRTLKDILLENNWAKYKHLFASDFSHDDFAAFNRFFVACTEIADARRRMLEVFYSNLNSKASVIQQKILEIDNLMSPEGQAKKQELIAAINAEDFVFEPNEPRTRILSSLQLMGRLSNTIAFEKLKKLGGIDG